MQVGPKLSKAGPALLKEASVTEIDSNGVSPKADITIVPKPVSKRKIITKTCAELIVVCDWIFLSSLTYDTRRGCIAFPRLAQQLLKTIIQRLIFIEPEVEPAQAPENIKHSSTIRQNDGHKS